MVESIEYWGRKLIEGPHKRLQAMTLTQPKTNKCYCCCCWSCNYV